MAKQKKMVVTRRRTKSQKQSRKGNKRLSSSVVKMSSKTRNANMIPNDNVDVRSESDVAKLIDLLKKNKMVIVLIYADWCGHCQTFKKDYWSKVANLKNRKLPMAQIKAEALGKTPLSNTNVEGYPSVYLVGQDMRPTDIPNPRDMRAMTAIANADPQEILRGAPANLEPTEDPAYSNEEEGGLTAEPASSEPASSESVSSNLNRNGSMFGSPQPNNYSTVGTMNRVQSGPSATAASPPDIDSDEVGEPMGDPVTLTGERLASLNSANRVNNASGPNAPIVGGSLFSYLYDVARNGVNKVREVAGVAKGGARKTRRSNAASRRRTARKLRR